MADTSKTIKGATDKELDAIINRLRKENEAQGLIAELKRRASSGYVPYDYAQEVSTEQPIDSLYHANKEISIKDATDEELDELIVRLRKENELQNLVSDLQRKSSTGPDRYEPKPVSTEKSIGSLYHYGILGMKWGRKKGATSDSTTVVRTRNSEDHDKKVLLKSRKASELTNDELQALSKRFQLEKQYKEIQKAERSMGKKFVDGIIDSVTKGATDTAMNYVKKQAGDVVEEILKKAKPAS